MPEYRLWDLGDRPGMVRDRHGAAIAGEVWALPTAAIGKLLAQVPPPLGFGTVALSDGPCLGFLAERTGIGRRAGDHCASAAGAHGWPGFATRKRMQRMQDLPLTDAALDAWIDAGQWLSESESQPEWRAAVRLHLRLSLGHAAALQDAPLPDQVDPAPVFRA